MELTFAIASSQLWGDRVESRTACNKTRRVASSPPPLILACTGARRNPATCTHQSKRKTRFDPALRAGGYAPVFRVQGSGFHLRFFDEQLGSAVGAIVYVKGSGNGLLTSIPL